MGKSHCCIVAWCLGGGGRRFFVMVKMHLHIPDPFRTGQGVKRALNIRIRCGVHRGRTKLLRLLDARLARPVLLHTASRSLLARSLSSRRVRLSVSTRRAAQELSSSESVKSDGMSKTPLNLRAETSDMERW